MKIKLPDKEKVTLTTFTRKVKKLNDKNKYLLDLVATALLVSEKQGGETNDKG